MTGEGEFIKNLLSNKERDKAFKKLLDLYQERLYWHIRKIVITHENADDVLQNTFIRVYKSIQNFEGKSSLHTWMFRIAYNESLRFLEKNNKKGYEILDDFSSKNNASVAEDAFFHPDEIQQKLHQIIDGFTEKQKRVFQMKYFDMP